MNRVEARMRQNWMAKFEEQVIAARPDLSGKIEWNTAIHFYNQGHSVDYAATRYLDTARQEFLDGQARSTLDPLI